MMHPEEAPKILRTLIRKKGILAMMVDQSRTGKGNVVPFLGRPNSLWLRLPMEANSEGAAVVTLRVLRKGDSHILRFETVYPPHTGPQELTQQLTQELERWIQENPQQWAWNYPKLWESVEISRNS